MAFLTSLSENTSKLEKLVIECYDKITRVGSPDSFTVMFNPTSWTESYTSVYTKTRRIFGVDLKSWQRSEPEVLNLKLILDSSVAGDSLYPQASDNVYDLVQDLLEKTYRIRGDIHEPNFLTLRWGKFNFDCRLMHLEVEYTSFARSGYPIRAELTAQFQKELRNDDNGTKIKNSPDMTHYRVVKAGDTLPILSNQIYGSPAYYMEIARVNNLKHFRALQAGMELYFPPLEKTTEKA